jgi:CRP/FNR family transcriptional regulator, anaerobic regulatory protein
MLSPQFNVDHASDEFSKKLFTTIQQIGSTRIIKAGEAIVNTEITAPFFFYIKSGIFKTTKMLGQETHILGFTFKGDLDGDPATLLQPPIQVFNIIALIDSEIIYCTWKNLEESLGAEKYHLVFNHFLIRYVHTLQNRLIEAIALTAEQRYKNLIMLHPKQIAGIPLADLSAYLGITPQSLSRIRSSKF